MATETPTLEVSPRDQTGSGPAGRLRREGMIPGVCYGNGNGSTSVTLDPDELRDVLDTGQGRNTVFRVDVDGKDQFEHVLVRDYQFDPVKRELTHVDLFVVSPDREIVVDVPVEPYGEAEGVRQGGQLQIVRPEVPVMCTPATIPDAIEVDVTDLGPDDSKKVSELEYPDGLESAAETDFPVIRVMMPRTGVIGLEPEGAEEEEEEEAEEVEGEEVEGEEAEEAEGEEEEGGLPEGAAAPGAG
ncbi:MAG: 50S ribosomal protein L25 [Bradymonadaceae bacterium]